MCGRPSTTIGFERRFNPILQLTAEDCLASTSEVPARPLNMTAILATNRGVADLAWAMPHDAHAPGVPNVAVPDGLSFVKQKDALVLDVRESTEYAAGHLPGAVSIPQADLASRLGEVPRDRELLVVCESGTRSLRAAHFLKQVGFEHVANLVGGTAAWRNASLPIERGT